MQKEYVLLLQSAEENFEPAGDAVSDFWVPRKQLSAATKGEVHQPIGEAPVRRGMLILRSLPERYRESVENIGGY